jgi:hypothetical protein
LAIKGEKKDDTKVEGGRNTVRRTTEGKKRTKGERREER